MSGRPAALEDSWPPLAGRLQTIEEPQRRVALWLIVAEALALVEYRLDDNILGLQFLTFGVDSDSAEASPEIVAYVLPQALLDNRDRDFSPLAEADDGTFERISLTVEPWDLTLHARLNLLYGTLGCWVRPKAGGNGIVTVRHVASGNRVHFDDGSLRRVLWFAPNCLDAAVVEGSPGHKLTTLQAVVPTRGDAVTVMTKSGALARNVDRVGQTYGTVTAAIPHCFLLDQPLQPGDSGSLVKLARGGGALGLYVGSLATTKGARGFCQGLYQLDRLFRLANQSAGFYEEVKQ